VITNLLKNAVEALPGGGTITVQTRRLNVGGAPFVEIRIGDDGPGVPPEILPRLFTPLKSTKGEAHSGLGLTIVSNLVTQLEGTISCSNKDVRGAEFVVRLPHKSTLP
jgi:signal transduction histidine kinase